MLVLFEVLELGGIPCLFRLRSWSLKTSHACYVLKVLELGGIPLMLRTSDMSKTIPDERVVVTFVMYLCSRLMDLRGDSQAASVIQVAWRRYQLQKVLFLQQVLVLPEL